MKNMVDICGGKMTLSEVNREIAYYLPRYPKRLVVDIRRRRNGYFVKIWIRKVDFEKGDFISL